MPVTLFCIKFDTSFCSVDGNVGLSVSQQTGFGWTFLHEINMHISIANVSIYHNCNLRHRGATSAVLGEVLAKGHLVDKANSPICSVYYILLHNINNVLMRCIQCFAFITVYLQGCKYVNDSVKMVSRKCGRCYIACLYDTCVGRTFLLYNSPLYSESYSNRQDFKLKPV